MQICPDLLVLDADEYRRTRMIDIVRVCIESIIGNLVANIDSNQRKAAQPNCQTRDIDDRVYFVPRETPEADLKVIADHFVWIIQ